MLENCDSVLASWEILEEKREVLPSKKPIFVEVEPGFIAKM